HVIEAALIDTGIDAADVSNGKLVYRTGVRSAADVCENPNDEVVGFRDREAAAIDTPPVHVGDCAGARLELEVVGDLLREVWVAVEQIHRQIDALVEDDASLRIRRHQAGKRDCRRDGGRTGHAHDGFPQVDWLVGLESKPRATVKKWRTAAANHYFEVFEAE